MKRAELSDTLDWISWPEREWRSTSAQLDARGNRAKARIPEQAAAFCFNLFDCCGLLVQRNDLQDFDGAVCRDQFKER